MCHVLFMSVTCITFLVMFSVLIFYVGTNLLFCFFIIRYNWWSLYITHYDLNYLVLNGFLRIELHGSLMSRNMWHISYHFLIKKWPIIRHWLFFWFYLSNNVCFFWDLCLFIIITAHFYHFLHVHVTCDTIVIFSFFVQNKHCTIFSSYKNLLRVIFFTFSKLLVCLIDFGLGLDLSPLCISKLSLTHIRKKRVPRPSS